MSAVLRTVLGDIDPSAAGAMSSHEHLRVSQRNWFSPSAAHPGIEHLPVDVALDEVVDDPMASLDNLLIDDLDLSVAEVERFASLGGGCLVDLTTIDFGRDLAYAAEVSRRTGVAVIAGTGWYVRDTHPDRLGAMSVEQLAADMIDDLVPGRDGATRAGVIGELGCSGEVEPAERRVLAAAAIAQRATGAAIAVHPPIPFAQRGGEILAILEAAGADLDRVALCHADHQLHDPGYLRGLLERGCHLMFDRFGNAWRYASLGWTEPSDVARADAIRGLVEDGFGDQLLAGQDICYKINLHAHAGAGYGHLLERVRGLFADRGLGRWFEESLLRANPQRFFSMPSSPASPLEGSTP